MIVSPVNDKTYLTCLMTVCTDSFRMLLRILAGVEDFARTNKHFERWHTYPLLHGSTWDHSCLYCFFHHGEYHLDSEWHGFLDCPLTQRPRREFQLLTKLDHFFECGCSVENLALLVARVREDKQMVNALARFSLQVHEYRQKWFRKLSTEALRKRLAEKLERQFNLWSIPPYFSSSFSFSSSEQNEKDVLLFTAWIPKHAALQLSTWKASIFIF